MKVSFPNMGQITAYKKVIEFFGHEPIVPERPTQRTFDLGVLHSPEFICYPSKVMAGTYIEACEKGAEVIISSGGSGPCRAGMYCEIHRRILKKLGYKTEIIIFDSFFKAPGLFIKNINRIRNGRNVFSAARFARYIIKMIEFLDTIEKDIKKRRAYEVNKGDFDKCLKQINEMFYNTSGLRELKKVNKVALEMVKAVPLKEIEENKKLRLGIVGEIFVVMDSATNMNIESRLNALGVEVTSTQYISDWIYHNIMPKPLRHDEHHRMDLAGKKYTTCNIGGHHLGNIGWIEHFAKEGYDGFFGQPHPGAERNALRQRTKAAFYRACDPRLRNRTLYKKRRYRNYPLQHLGRAVFVYRGRKRQDHKRRQGRKAANALRA
jgi:predicted nucleotide-binding protein (sugar kinase/HSP70/actin superfamily)